MFFSEAETEANDGIGDVHPDVSCVLVSHPNRLEVLLRATNADAQSPVWKSAFSLPYERPEALPLQRGDAATLVSFDGTGVVSVDRDGKLSARLNSDTIEDAVKQFGETEMGVLKSGLGLDEVIPLDRGDSHVLVELSEQPVLTIDRQGRTGFVPDEQTLNYIGEHVPLRGGQTASADLIHDHDAWNVRQSGDFLYYNSDMWDGVARDFIRRKSREPWINGRSEVLLKLLYGDELADAPVPSKPYHFAHIMSLDDDFGVQGLNGEVPEEDAKDILRVDRGFIASAADSRLANRSGPKHWIGARSEAVMGADLDELIEGQGFANLIRCKQQFAKVLKPYGRFPAVECVTLLMAAITNDESFSDKMLELIDKIVIETGARQINMFQPVGDAFNAEYPSVLGTIKSFVESGAAPTVLVSPMYWCERRPGGLFQPTRTSTIMLAELDGLAGRDWLAPLAFGAIVEENVIFVDFEVMDGYSLKAPTFGLTVSSDNNVEITSVNVRPDPETGKLTRLAITCSDVPIGGVLRYAYGNQDPSLDLSGTAYCSGGDLSDDWEHPSVTGNTLRRYAFSFEFKL